MPLHYLLLLAPRSSLLRICRVVRPAVLTPSAGLAGAIVEVLGENHCFVYGGDCILWSTWPLGHFDLQQSAWRSYGFSR
jgi:hypothetical protein